MFLFCVSLSSKLRASLLMAKVSAWNTEFELFSLPCSE